MAALLRLARNLIAGLRLAAFLPVKRESFHLTPGQLPLLILFGLAVDSLCQLAITDGSRSFNIYGVSFSSTIYLAVLLILFLVAGLQSRVVSVVPMAVVLLSAWPLLFVLAAAAEHLDSRALLQSWQLWCAVFLFSSAWIVAIGFRSVRLVYRAAAGRAVALAFLYLLLVTAVGFGIPYQPIWYDDDFNWERVVNVWEAGEESGEAEEEDEWAAYRRLDIESAYSAQPDMMAEAVEALAPQRPGVTDLYFVGFAGYAHENVFLNEVLSIQSLFDERFDTTNRSIALINHLETVWDRPLANRHNLQFALNSLGGVIDPEEDVVFLYLTSHGSPDHRLAVSFGTFNFRWLTAKKLRADLDRAGIKWRVVVVSACYSGGFLDDLQDENSLILTASHRDRTSFGCSNDRDYTYFGEAYFRDQLSIGHSFTNAFYLARTAIAAREAREGLTPSMPQIYIGSAIERKLSELEGRLRPLNSAAINSDAARGRASR